MISVMIEKAQQDNSEIGRPSSAGKRKAEERTLDRIWSLQEAVRIN